MIAAPPVEMNLSSPHPMLFLRCSGRRACAPLKAVESAMGGVSAVRRRTCGIDPVASWIGPHRAPTRSRSKAAAPRRLCISQHPARMARAGPEAACASVGALAQPTLARPESEASCNLNRLGTRPSRSHGMMHIEEIETSPTRALPRVPTPLIPPSRPPLALSGPQCHSVRPILSFNGNCH